MHAPLVASLARTSPAPDLIDPARGGYPADPVAGILAAVQWLEGAWLLWWRPVGLLIVSYALQWVGHRMEGNDMGEWIVIRKMFGKSYTAVSPKFTARSTVRDSSHG